MFCKEHAKFFLKLSKRENPYFWDTQPVLRSGEEPVGKNEAIKAEEDVGEIQQEPDSLPGDFRWDTLDFSVHGVVREVADFLSKNYGLSSQADSNVYSFDFVGWLLQCPGWIPEWNCGIRVARNGKLVGLISGVPVRVRLYQETLSMAAILVLCVHRKLRRKRMMAVMVRELARRVRLRGVFQGVYVSVSKFHGHVASCTRWHRPLHIENICRHTYFSDNFKNTSLSLLQKRYHLSENLTLRLRLLRESSVKQAHALLNTHLEKYKLAPLISEDQFRHWFLPKSSIVYSFVRRSTPGMVTDFISFYEVDVTTALLLPPESSHLRAACLFYYVATSVPPDVLVQEALILAKKMKFDVFCAVGALEIEDFAEKLKFVAEDKLYYSLYNWRCSLFDPESVGLVLPHLPNVLAMTTFEKISENMCPKCRSDNFFLNMIK